MNDVNTDKSDARLPVVGGSEEKRPAIFEEIAACLECLAASQGGDVIDGSGAGSDGYSADRECSF